MNTLINTDTRTSTIAFPFGSTETTIRIGYMMPAEELKAIKHYCAEAIIIADQYVNDLWNNEIYNRLSNILPVHLYTVNATESEKTLATVTTLLESIMLTEPSRCTAIISFGGGLTGNIAGVIAGLLFRGVRLIHIPTTLLAMSDAILSQKQAVNGPISKNTFGLYHKATLNFIDIKYLSTIDQLHLYGGIIEIVKNCLTFDQEAIGKLSHLLELPFTPEKLLQLVELGIRQKSRLLKADPFEKEQGIVLEYGHTIGHSLELNIRHLFHGQAVGLGMLAAAYIAGRRGWITSDDIGLHVALLRLCECPLRIPDHTSIENVMQSVKSDNKKGKIPHTSSETPMILLDGIGKVRTNYDSYLVPVALSEITAAIAVLKTDYFESAAYVNSI
ncbi:3-dehydroquinate synthase family protein [Chitinophaga nivalis]|uniref:3-dehydroquinate synthase n=1 Tax=Chitinophaga nivalis TaxID=2991709 RepID=A0ABT3IMZ4_9BACT|nr:hypothetical protein [Chitinophaga nivalis]MCW3464965.1 hypothetical protein [Chitinophaga nivalis]MCW3485343.1 hypothetical protein [Chitinophaga nivalis]